MKTFLTNCSIGITLAISLATATLARADDIDIYVNSTPSTVNEPMVMFSLDWRSNLGSTICNGLAGKDPTIAADQVFIANKCGWPDPSFVANFTWDDINTNSAGTIDYFELLRAVLRKVFDSIDGVKVGLMINHDDNCTGGMTCGPSITQCSNGGYILSGFKSMYSGDANGNKAAFHTLLSNIPVPGGTQAHSYQGKELYFEFFRYLTGQGIHNGHLGWKDFGDTVKTTNLDTDFPNISWDTTIENSAHDKYVTPIDSAADCVKIFAINIMFQVSNHEDDSDNFIKATKANGGMNGVNISGSNNNFSTVINWMYNNDMADGTYGTAPNVFGKQNVTSYFLVDSPNTTTNGYAKAGGTGSAITLGSDPTTMVNAIKNIFSQILSVSTSFVSASVPVNVFNRTDYLNDVYIALFQAEKNGKPQWVGNLKKLMLQQDSSGNWFIGDSLANPAFAPDGKLNFNDLTYWSNPAGADVVAADTTVGEITGRDGRSVNRGGAGQQINGFLSGSPGLLNTDIGARQLYTEPASYTNGTPTALVALDATATNASTWWSNLNANGVYSTGTTLNATTWSSAGTYATAVAADQTNALNLLKFARGIDVMDQNANGSTTDTRPWLMADPIHSRPLAINYGATTGYSQSNPDIRIVVGGNDGMIHMVRNTTTGGAQSGKEIWAFMPLYAMNIQSRLMSNTTGSPISPYGIDGETIVYTKDLNQDGTIDYTVGDKAYIIFGLRRGGRHYYALDVSNPDSPKMLWHIDSGTTGFSELGLTFSTPKLVHVSYDANVKVPALIFGGGYDTNKDTRSNSIGTDDSIGNAIYIVDVATGALIWKATYGASTGNVSSTQYAHSGMVDSIPAKVTPMDSDYNGAIDRFYVGDTGGVIWRGDLVSTNRANWKVTQFASVGRHLSGAGKRQDRRFFHALDVAQTLDSTGPYDAVAVGTGDRPNPLDKGISSGQTPHNWFFMFKDRNTTSGSPSATTILSSDVANLSNNCFQQVNVTCTSTQTTALVYGWKIGLDISTGEKNLSAAAISKGVIYFTTYTPPVYDPSNTTCDPSEGKSYEYALNLQNASAVLNNDLSNSVTTTTGDTVDLQLTDRYRSAGSGIASDVVLITKYNSLTGNSEVLKIGHDGTVDNLGANRGKRTFWYKRKE